MKKVLRCKPSASMVVALIALCIAASGTAVAASKLVKGDTLIAKNSLSGNRLRNHAITGTQVNLNKLGKVTSAASADHAKTADTATKATNATNANHATSANHAASADSATNSGHSTNSDQLGGVAAANYETASSVLQSGQTEHGVFAGGGGTGDNIVIQIQFDPHLPSALDSSHVIFVNGTSATHCPGQGRADRGYLCWYPVTVGSFTFGSFGDPTTDTAGASSDGMDAQYSSSGPVRISGEWAVTAP